MLETLLYKALPYSDKAVRRKSIGRCKSSRFCHSVSFKHPVHNQARFDLRMEVQMRVNIRSGRECTVSKPYLDLLHGYTACQKEAGATMPEIMKPDFLSVEFLKYPAKMIRYIIWSHELAGLVEADVVEVVPAVRPFKQLTVHFLLFFFCKQ